jgi:hypothetical protein
MNTNILPRNRHKRQLVLCQIQLIRSQEFLLSIQSVIIQIEPRVFDYLGVLKE